MDLKNENKEQEVEEVAEEAAPPQEAEKAEGKAQGAEKITLTPEEVESLKRDAAEAARKELEEAKEAEELNAMQAAGELEAVNKRLAGKLEEAKSKVDVLEVRAAEAEAALSEYVKQLSEGIDPSILALLGDKSEAQKLKWLTANRDKFAPKEEGEAPPRKVPPTPQRSKQGQGEGEAKKEQAARQAHRRFFRYSF